MAGSCFEDDAFGDSAGPTNPLGAVAFDQTATQAGVDGRLEGGGNVAAGATVFTFAASNHQFARQRQTRECHIASSQCDKTFAERE